MSVGRCDGSSESVYRALHDATETWMRTHDRGSKHPKIATLTKLPKATELSQLDEGGTSEVSVRDIRKSGITKP